jgi:hypothetical protein
MMVKHATQLDLKTDVVHESYKTSKGKLAQSFRLGKHTTGVDARGSYPGIYTIDGPTDAGASSSQDPPTKGPYDPLLLEGASHSHGAPRGKRGKFNFLAKGLFACFNMIRKEAREREADRRWLAQELHRHEKNQKEMAASLNLPHSLVHEMRTFDPPSPVPNPPSKPLRSTITPLPSKPLLFGHRTRHDAATGTRFARMAINSMALYAKPQHV